MAFRFAAGAVVAASLGAIVASPASAQTIPLVVFENASDTDVADLIVTLEVVDLDDQVKFIIANESGMEATVTSIYVELTEFTAEALSSPVVVNGDGTSYSVDERVSPRSPAGSVQFYGGRWDGNIAGIQPDRPKPMVNALNPGEEVAIVFDLAEGYTSRDIFDAISLSGDGFRVAAHVQAVGSDGQSVWIINPSPATVALLGLGGLVAARRRRTG